MKFSNQTTFHISSQQALRLEALAITRPDKTPDELIAQMLEMGLYQIEYRKRNNERKRNRERLGRETEKLVNSGRLTPQATRELAIKLGLAQPEVVDDDMIEVDEANS